MCLILSGCTEPPQPNNANIDVATDLRRNSPTPAANESVPIRGKEPVDEKQNLSDDFAGTAGVTDKKKKVTGAPLLTAVRTAKHENFDRLVFEFSGAELPGYHIEYIDKPVRQCGSGNVVPLSGDAWLEVRFSPANAHTDEGEPTITRREMAPGHKIVKELISTCDFEAEVEWVAGVASPNRYRVLELRNPTRLVVDIKY